MRRYALRSLGREAAGLCSLCSSSYAAKPNRSERVSRRGPIWDKWGARRPWPWWFGARYQQPEIVLDSEAPIGPDGTIKITIDHFGFYHFGAPVTIKAGQAVLFTNGNNAPHTITEGSNGQAATNACVDVGISQNAKVTVTFYLPGDYQITCRPHPPMNTAVHVK